MSGCSKSSDDDDDTAAKLMPNVAKLIHEESGSLGSKGSTSMSLCGMSEKDYIEMQNPELLPKNDTSSCQQRRPNSVFQDVANKFLRRGSSGKRTIGARKPSALTPLNPNSRISWSLEKWKSSYDYLKENVRPIAATQIKQSTRSILQQKREIAAKKFTKDTSLPVFKLAQRRSVNPEIQRADKCNAVLPFDHLAPSHELDEEALEEEEVSSARLTRIKPVLVSEVLLQHVDDISENNVENGEVSSRRERENLVSTPLNAKVAEATPPNRTHGQGQSGDNICTQSMLSKTPGHRDKDMRVPEPPGKGDVAALSSVPRHNGNAIFRSEGQQIPNSGHLAQEDDPRVTMPMASFSSQGSGGPNTIAAQQEDSIPGQMSTFREDAQSTPIEVKRSLKQKDVADVPLREGAYSTQDPSATPPRNPLLLTGHRYSRGGRSIDMSQRRLAFDSTSESVSTEKVGDSDSSDASVSSVEFKGRTNSATEVLNQEIIFDSNHLEAKEEPFTHVEVIGQVDGRDSNSCSSKPKTATHSGGGDDRETLLTGSLAQDRNMPAFEALEEVEEDPEINVPKPQALEEVEEDPEMNTRSPQARPAIGCKKIKRLTQRTRADLGAPIDGGREWKEGRRVSTRIKSRPLDWWRGEKMLYGRVHSTLCTLIGIKTASPDPLWPRAKAQRGDYNIRNFYVHSFVDDSYHDLLRLAAQ